MTTIDLVDVYLCSFNRRIIEKKYSLFGSYTIHRESDYYSMTEK